MAAINEGLLAAAMPGAMEGMALLRRHEVRRGDVLYRFVDLTRSPAPAAANGPWWLEYEAFQQIKHFGMRHGHPLHYSARLHAAILYEWSEVTGYVRAEVLQPLAAWKGRGKQVRSTGRDGRDLPTMTPMQSVNEVYQLFIPGLGHGAPMFHSALKLLEVTPA
jgi:hypothetical protein